MKFYLRNLLQFKLERADVHVCTKHLFSFDSQCVIPMNISINRLILVLIGGLALGFNAHAADVEGELFTWHKVSVTFDGPDANESYPSTFLDNRLTVTFTHKDVEYVVPGFFAADGDAGATHAGVGNKWRAVFTPDRTGKWTYHASFATGKGVALNGKKGKAYKLKGSDGEFQIQASPVSVDDKDFRGKGRLEYVNKHHMKFAGSGQYFLKGGTGSPENFLAFDGIDGTWDAQKRPNFPSLGEDQLHHYGPHRAHWVDGDPYWTNEEGRDNKGIIGLINYISDQGLNSFYLMPLTYEGDGCDIWPWINPKERTTFDISKLDQWEMVFSHMQQKGIHIHMLLTETENESLFELMDGGGDFADTRKLYYRELVSRFGHHLALSWNLGEESGWNDDKGGKVGAGNTHEQRKAFTQYIDELDAYDHPMKVHEIDIVEIYPQLVGYEHFDGPSLQRHSEYNKVVKEFVDMSDEGEHPWLVSMDEPLGWEFGLSPDSEDETHDKPRKEVLWGM